MSELEETEKEDIRLALRKLRKKLRQIECLERVTRPLTSEEIQKVSCLEVNHKVCFGKIGERKINHNTMSYPPCILIARCWFQRKGSWIVIRNFQGVKLCPLQETAHIKIESTAICRDVFAV